MKKPSLILFSLILFICNIQAQINFTPSANYSTGSGSSPQYLTSADFNGDGNLDIATANIFSSSLSILLGSNSGTFSPLANYTIGVNPHSVTAADFNNDGKIDLAATYGGATNNTITILIGNGSGSFTNGASYVTTNLAVSITPADFNNDGNIDLALANYSAAKVSILLGNGTGVFAPATIYNVGSGPLIINVDDLNNDGYLDIASVNFNSNDISILIGSATGTFAPAVNYSVGINPTSIVCSDYNTDGKKDLAVTNYNTSNVSIMLGNGFGSFSISASYNVGLHPYSITAADFNNDLKIDLAVANTGSNNVSVLLGTATGSFANAPNYSVDTYPIFVISKDFNNDGKTDLATANYIGNTVSVLLNTICPTTPPTLALTSQSNNYCYGDSTGAALFTSSGSSSSTYTWSPTGGNLAGAYGLAAGVYTLATTSECGITASSTVNITQANAVVFNSISNSSTICLGNTATFTANASGGTGAITYDWASPLTIITSSVLLVTPTITTSYTLYATDIYGCSVDTTITLSVAICTGINQLTVNGDSSFNTYPNPNNGGFSIETPHNHTSLLQIFSISGALMFEKSIEGSKNIIHTGNMEEGVYTVKLFNDQGISSKKLVIVK